MRRIKLLHGVAATVAAVLLAITAAGAAGGNGNGKGNGGTTTSTSTSTSTSTTSTTSTTISTTTTSITTTSTTTPSVPPTIVTPALPTTGDELARCVGVKATGLGGGCSANFTLADRTWVRTDVTTVGHFGKTYAYASDGRGFVLHGAGWLDPGEYRFSVWGDAGLVPSGACALNRCVNVLPPFMYVGAGVITGTISRVDVDG